MWGPNVASVLKGQTKVPLCFCMCWNNCPSLYMFHQCLYLLPDVSSIQTAKVPLFLGLNALYFPDEDYFGAVLKKDSFYPAAVRFSICCVNISGQKIDILSCVSLFGSQNAPHMLFSKDSQTSQLWVSDHLNPCMIAGNRQTLDWGFWTVTPSDPLCFRCLPWVQFRKFQRQI